MTIMGAAAFLTAPISRSATAIYESNPQGQPTTVVAGKSNASGYSSVSSTLSTATLILLVAGQSLPANYNQDNTTTLSNTVQFLNPYDGTVYLSPYGSGTPGSGYAILGASDQYSAIGNGESSYVPLIGQKLITAGTFARFIQVNASIGSTSIQDWSAAGAFSHRLRVAYQQCINLGWVSNSYATIAVLWSQGEEDLILGTSQATYENQFYSVQQPLKNMGFNGPWWVVQESFSSGHTTSPNPVTSAQLALVNGNTILNATPVVTVPPGFDIISRGFDGTHFDTTGENSAATLVANAMIAYY